MAAGSWSVTLGSQTYSYAQLLEIIKDAVLNHYNAAIRYTSFMRDGQQYAIVDIAPSDTLNLDGIKYGVYVEISKEMPAP